MKTSRRLFVAVLLLSASFGFGQQPAKKRGITPEDYFSFEFVSAPELSPDGRLVAYVVTVVDQKQNRRNSSIWMAEVEGGRPPWQFTTSP